MEDFANGDMAGDGAFSEMKPLFAVNPEIREAFGPVEALIADFHDSRRYGLPRILPLADDFLASVKALR